MDFVYRAFFSFNTIGFFTTYSKNSPLKFEYIFGNISFIVLFIAVLFYWFDFSDTKYASKKLKSFCMIVANLSLTCLLLMRWWESGHFPLSNLYESLLGLSWSFTTVHLIVTLIFTKKLKRDFGGENDKIGAITAPTALLTSVFATFFLPPEMLRATTLIPALKSNWLTMHVTVMIVSYAFLLVGSLLSIALCAYKLSTKVIQSSSNRDNSLEQWAPQKHLYNYLPSDPNEVRSSKAQALAKEPVDISQRAQFSGTWRASATLQNQILGSRKLWFGFGLKLLPVRNAILNTRAFRWKTEPTSSFSEAPARFDRQSPYQAAIQAGKNNQPQKQILDISLQHLGSSDFLGCQQLSENLKKKQNNLQFFYPRVQSSNLDSALASSEAPLAKNSIFNTATEYSNSNKKQNPLGLNFFRQSNKKSITKNILSVQKSLDFLNLEQKNSLIYLNKKAQTQTEHEKIQSDVCIWLNTMSYRILGLGFPLLTIGILSGAVWANEAWGSYWSWDPKETWALITWLVFAIYFHSRYYRSSDTSIIPASIASIGFIVIWICYLGVNLLQTGLHSYGWFALLVSLNI